jgi:Domain of unknown function (DUF6456)
MTAHRKGGPSRYIGRTTGFAEFMIDGAQRLAAVNLDESPLAGLMRRKGKDGRAYLTIDEFNAGERLRADFSKGMMMQRVSANWSAAVSSSRRGAPDALANLTDTALAARQRLAKALAAAGPELSGALIDICCFLKGLEQVEMERQWPVRSGKLMLKTGLAALARHYNPAAPATANGIQHWGGEGYRPEIGG